MAGSGSVDVAAVSIAGGGAAPAHGGGFAGPPPYVALGGVFGTSRTSFPLCWGGCRPHSLSRYRERRRVDGWCWGWRGGVADYPGTHNKKGDGKNLACGQG